jgi:hypothetical protein
VKNLFVLIFKCLVAGAVIGWAGTFNRFSAVDYFESERCIGQYNLPIPVMGINE